VLLVAVAVVYVGTFVESSVAFPGCSRPLDVDGSTTQDGHSSMRWVPPAVHCSYPRDDLFGTPAAHDDRIATFGIVAVGVLSAVLILVVVIPMGGLREDLPPER
jgi:hypothetical protein